MFIHRIVWFEHCTFVKKYMLLYLPSAIKHGVTGKASLSTSASRVVS